MLARGHRTVHKEFNAAQTKKIGSSLLNPANLLYFAKLAIELPLIEEDDNEQPRELYDLLLTFGFGFHEDEDISGSIELF